jgi:hypothetical protein
VDARLVVSCLRQYRVEDPEKLWRVKVSGVSHQLNKGLGLRILSRVCCSSTAKTSFEAVRFHSTVLWILMSCSTSKLDRS